MQAADIMIHIDQELELDERRILESKLREIDGVVAPRFNKDHLLLVAYNPDMIDSSELLGVVISKGYRAQLVGM